MQLVFHKVAQKPGKPFLFGRFTDGPVVFGFPGNPYSTFACFYIFFYPWLKASLQQTQVAQTAVLDTDISFTPNLDYHVSVKTFMKAGTLFASPVSGTNSGDLVAIGKADGLLTLPKDKNFFSSGEVYPLISFYHNCL
jgi:molybdopterin molybdotransferase